MPGYQELDGDGNEITLWDFPSQQEINEQDTDFLRACFHLHKRFKVCGMPYAGYANNRNSVVDIITLLENEESKYESWQYKNRDHVEE